jgi:hypothetical protein
LVARRKTTGSKYEPEAQEYVREAMSKLKRGSLRSSSGRKVSAPKQAVAIGLSEARSEGMEVPLRGRSTRSTRAPTKRAAAAKRTKKAVAGTKRAAAKRGAKKVSRSKSRR